MDLSNSKSFQISKTILRIFADFINAVVCMISILPLTSNPFSLKSITLRTFIAFQVRKVHLVSLSPSCPTAFLALR